MTNIYRSLILLCLLVVMAEGGFAQQSKHPNLDLLETKGQGLTNRVRDFVAAAIANKDSVELGDGGDLAAIASAANDHVLSAQHLLMIYAMLSCKTDQDKIWETIKDDLSYYAKVIDLQIKQASRKLAGMKLSTLTKLGAQFVEELRELKGFLESVRPD